MKHNVYLPDDLSEIVQSLEPKLNVSKICQDALREAIANQGRIHTCTLAAEPVRWVVQEQAIILTVCFKELRWDQEFHLGEHIEWDQVTDQQREMLAANEVVALPTRLEWFFYIERDEGLRSWSDADGKYPARACSPSLSMLLDRFVEEDQKLSEVKKVLFGG